MSHQLLDLYLGRKEENAPEKNPESAFIELDASMLDRYVGGYRINGTNALVGFYKDGEMLVGNILGIGKDYFYPVSETEFRNYSGNATITFQTDENTKGMEAHISLNGETQTAHKIELAIDRTDFVGTVSGLYYGDPLGTVCTIQEKNEHLILSHRKYQDMPLFPVDTDHLVGAWGFIRFQRDESGRVQGFHLTDELIGFKKLWFSKIPE